MLHERSYSQRTTNDIIKFIGNFQSRQIYKGQKQISDCQRLGRRGGDWGMTANGSPVSLGVMKIF